MEQQYTGTVKSFSVLNGWGFIECPELPGQDVFLLKKELKGAVTISKGDKVNFSIASGPKGPQATEVTLVGQPNSAGTPGKGRFDQIFFGVIKNFDPQKGGGFIANDEAKKVFDKDVFVTKNSIPGGMALEGTQVQFTVRMEEKGPVAQSVRLVNMAGCGIDAQMGLVAAMGMGFGVGKGAGRNPWDGARNWGGHQLGAINLWGGSQQWGGKCDFRSMPTIDERQVYFGVLKHVNKENGWGHIACEATQKVYGKDMFVMKTSLEPHDVSSGQWVRFTVTMGAKGPHAQNICAVGELNPDAVFSGQIKSYNDVKGWGFIESEAARNVYQSDIFVHKKELKGDNPSPGDSVQFGVDIAGGRPSAKNVTCVTHNLQDADR